MSRPPHVPYAANTYNLGEIRLTGYTEAEADVLGTGLAAIDPWLRMGYTARALAGYLRRPDPAAHRFAIRAGGALAGAIAVRNPWLRGPYLELLGVLSHAHRRGIGRTVMDWFEAEAPPSAGFLWVLCSDFNESALAFYRRCGFSEVTSLENLVADGFTEILLRKALPLRR